MKKLKVLIITLCGVVATTAAMGQTTYTWTGAGDGVSLVNTNNWDPNGVPSGATQDTAEWDGRTSTNLVIRYGTASLPSTGYGSVGINLYLTANQTKSVQIVSSAAISAGVGVNYITLDSGSGGFTLGDNTANNLLVFGRPAGAIHLYVNNSANPATINPSVRFQAGGGNGYTYEFGGTGDWIVNSYLMPDNGAFSPSFVQVDGPGNVFWAAGKTGAYNPNSALGGVWVTNGALVLKSSGLFTGTANQAITNDAVLVFDAASQSQTLNGVISSIGSLTVSNGALTLAGQSTYTGNTILAGGELIVGSAEGTDTNGAGFGPLGVGGTISFTGGTLGFSVNNTDDYSSRFSTTASQAYRFDTAGQNVTFTNGLTSSGGTLTKVGPGTLTLTGANTFSGDTTVSAGKLVFDGTKSGTGNITVADGAALGVTANGSQVKPDTLTVGTTGGATLEFNGVSSTSTAPLAVGSISSAGTVTINVKSGTFAVGQSYPLLTWTSGSAPAVNLGLLIGATGNLSTNGNTIQLNVTALSLFWTGLSGIWDTTTAGNWLLNGSPAVFSDSSPVVFDDSASGQTDVSVTGGVQPANVIFNNSAKAYTVTSSSGNAIGGSGSLIKAGAGTATLAGGANTYSGPTMLIEGTLSVGAVANGGAASDIGAATSDAGNLLFNGGTLQYSGGAGASDHLFTVGNSGGAVDASGSGALNLNNSGAVGLAGSGPRVLTLTGTNTSDNTLAASLPDNGGPTSLTKNGAGKWVMTGTNTYSGATTIAGGTLQVGAGGESGSLGTGDIADNASLVFNRTGTLNVSGAVNGSGAVTKDGSGTVVLAANNSYSGLTTINAGALQIGNGGADGTLASGANVTNNGTLIFDSTGNFTMNSGSILSGTGQLIKRGSGLLMLRGTESYSGGTTIDAGAQLQLFSGNEGLFQGGGTITNNGTLIVVRQDNAVAGITNNIIGSGLLWKDVNNPNAGDVTLAGTNTYTGGTFIAGGAIVLGDATTPGAGSIAGDVIFTNSIVNDTLRSLVFNRPDNFTFTNNIIGAVVNPPALVNAGAVEQRGFGMVTLTGNNTYPGGTTINGGAMQVGNGGTSGSIGTGTATVSGYLIINRSDDLTLANDITGTGYLTQQGSGTTTLASTNLANFTGITTVSNGTLVVTGGTLGGELDVDGGTVAAAAPGTVGTLNIASVMIVNSGTVLATLNKSLPQSNTVYSVAAGTYNYGGAAGKLKLVNAGPTLAVGDKFTIFDQPVTTGDTMTIESTGFTVTNNLAVDGSVTVTAVTAVTPPTILTSVSNGQLTLSWPAANVGMHLQSQTNSLTTGLGTNWVNVPGTDASSSYSTSLDSTNATVFYRLAQ